MVRRLGQGTIEADASRLRALLTEATAGGGSSPSLHSPVTLTAAADVVLDLTGQELDLDGQSANTVLAGPTAGAADKPTFRSLVDADIPAAIARDSEVTSAIATHAADDDAHHDPVTAGDGIDLSGQQVSVDITDIIDIAYGLTENSNNIRINIGDGLEFDTGALEVDLSATSGLEFSGGDLQIADSIAGAGLTIASKVLAVGAGDGIDVAADSVAVDVTDIIDTDYGLTENSNNIRINLEASGGLDFTGGALGVDVTDFIDTSYGLTESSNNIRINIGDGLEFDTGALEVDLAAAWSGLEFSSGDLRVDVDANFTWAGAHDFDANVTVTDGADFTVGANILFVDASGTNVGINCAPDPQFDLDVAGNLRAQGWIVGKHAIQLKDALMILHFDGPEPFESDFTGNPTGHMGQVAAVANGVVYRPGVLQKGVQLAEAATNQVVNPTFANNVTDGWSFAQGGSGGSAAQDTTFFYIGSASCKITASDSGNAIQYCNSYSLGNGDTIAIQVRMYRDTDVSADVLIYDVTNTTARAILTPSATDEWEHIRGTWTNDTGGAVNVRINVRNKAGDGSSVIWIDAAQMEDNAYPTPYLDGTMGDGHSWSGTAHNSTSARTSARLDYDSYAAGLVRSKGSIGGYYLVDTVPSEAGMGLGTLFDFYVDSSNRIMLRVMADDQFDLYINGAYRITGVGSGSLSHGTEIFWVVTWDFDDDDYHLYIYENGTKYTDSDSTSLSEPTGLVDFVIGGAYSHTDTYQVNGIVDDVFIVARAMDADEVQTIQESEAPVFAETSTWSWRSANNLVWADAEGLWGVDDSGNASLGWSGVDSKSWGGKTLDKGDFLLGRDAASVGNLYWDQSVGDLLIGIGSNTHFQIDASEARVIIGYSAGGEYVTIDGTNGIRIYGNATLVGQWDTSGNATFGNVATDHGNMYWNQGNSRVEFRGGTDGTSVEAYIDTDGSIVAGGGAVTLNSDGVKFEQGDASANLIKWYDGAANIGFIQVYENPSAGDTTTLMYFSGQAVTNTGTISIVAYENNFAGAEAGLTLAADDGGSYFLVGVDSTDVLKITTDYALAYQDVRISSGLYVGANSDPAAGTITATDYIVALGGLHVGGTSDPGTDNLVVDGTTTLTGGISGNVAATGYGTFPGGVHVGGTSDPGDDNLVVDGHTTVTDYVAASGGVHVGGTSDPGTDNLVVDGASTLTGDVSASADIRITSGGLYVGADVDPANGTITATDYIVALGGLHVGGTADPGTDNLLVDGYAQIESSLRIGGDVGSGVAGYITFTDTYTADTGTGTSLTMGDTYGSGQPANQKVDYWLQIYVEEGVGYLAVWA